jgi:hypothetical protein
MEWAEKLALKPADLAPEEYAALKTHLAACPGCAATYADYRMLMTRLRALPRPALPPLAPLAADIATGPEVQGEADGVYDGAGSQLRSLPEATSARAPGPLAPARRRIWPQGLSAIAAALLLTALVGSLVAVLLNRGQGSTFTLRSGWAEIAVFSGVGSKTFTTPDLTLPYLWGTSFTCTGSDSVRILAVGQLSGDFGGGPCTSDSSALLSPQDVHFDFLTFQIVTLQVIASSDTHWALQVAQAVIQPTKPGPEWLEGIGDAGRGNVEAYGVPIFLDGTGQPLEAKTWGIVFGCFGPGRSSIQFEPDIGTISMPPCDGRAKLIKIQYPSATHIESYKLRATGDILWYALIVGCADEQKCGA